jgi:hypothetical protein
MKNRRKYTLNSVETYDIVMNLKDKNKRFGLKSIKNHLDKLIKGLNSYKRLGKEI